MFLPTRQKYNEEKLLSLLKKGDMAAFSELYWKYQKAIYQNGLKLTKDVLVAEDIVQEVFISLWEKRDTIDAGRSVSGWLFVSSYNRSINALKRKLRESIAITNLSQEDIDKSEEPDKEPDISDLRLNILEEAVSHLPQQKRRVFELCKLQGMSYEEAANEMRISKHTVKEYLSDAISFIKEYVCQHPIVSIAITGDLISNFFLNL
jgi:RNA polymerase sigma-70 factor (ECF subfamily)